MSLNFRATSPTTPSCPACSWLKAIAQAGGALLLTEIPDRENKLMVFTGIDSAKFRKPVVPGDQVRIEVKVLNWRSRCSANAGNGNRRRQVSL